MSKISQRRISDQHQQKAESLLQVLVQLANPDRIILVALPDGHVLSASKNLADLLLLLQNGKEENNLQQILGLPDQEAYDNLLGMLQDRLEIAGEIPTPLPLAEGKLTYLCRLLHYQDTLFLCTEIAGLTGKALLLVEEDNYHNVFDNSTEALFILDSSSKFIDLNKRSLELIKQQKREVVGQSIYRTFGLNLFERVALKGQVKQVLAGKPQKFEWWLQEQDQDLLPVEISLERGVFHGEVVILGSARNLYQLIGSEQEIRFRNHQLEFVNNLITNLSTSDSQQEVLDYTLDKLLEKSDLAAGCVYNYHSDSQKATLSYSNGTNGNPELPSVFSLSKTLADKLLKKENLKAITTLSTTLEKKLKHKLTIVPIVTEKKLVALLILWTKEDTKMPHSFLALLNFIGGAIGSYIARHELMQQLTYSEDKYKILFESAYDAILLFNDNGVVVDCNEKTTQLFRCKREELIGHKPIHFSPEAQPDGELSATKAEALMHKALSSDEPVTFEWKNIRKDGTFFDAEISLNRIFIDGKYYVQAFKRDITQRKLAQNAQKREEVMRESMSHFRNFLEKVNLIYYTLDPQGTIVYTNDYFLKYLEYESEELIGKDFFELLVPEHEREKRRRDFFKTMESKQLNTYYERDILSKHGQVKTMRWNSMFDYGPDGELMGVTSVGKDMTDKRVAMEALKDNKIRLQDLFDNAHDLIQNISVDNKFIFVNRAWKDRLGYTDEDIESLTLNEIVHPYYKAKLIYQLRNLYKGEQVNKIETVFLTKAGKPVHLIGSINCSWQDGKPVATRAILHDITDRIKAERLQKVYYSIANLAISSKDHNSLYSAIHRELSKIIETRNIYIALCDNDYQRLQFVYLVDQFIDKTKKEQLHRPFSNGISEYIIRTGKPLYAQKQELLKLAEEHNITIHGALPEVMLCSPLAIGDRIIGVITLQDYYSPDAYVHADTEILHFISNQVALAIERKRNEEQINNQNAKLKAIFESGTHHMWSVNRNYEITSFNRNFAKLLGTRGYELHSNKPLDLNIFTSMPGNMVKFWKQKYDAAFKGIPQHFEVHMQEPESWSEVFLNPIYLEDATFEEISGIALDITDKKKSQLALTSSEEKFRRIFESFQDVYYRSSLHGIIELVSPSIANLLGYTETEVLGTESKRFFANPSDNEALKQRVLQEHKIRDLEVEMITKDGTRKSVLLDSRLVYDAKGNPVSFEGVIRDVSELKRTQKALVKAKEEAENLLKVKTQFLANMSHELRTPMNGIIGMIDLLSQINTDHEQREYIDTLRKSSDALLEILNDILDLSKMQAGKLVISETGIDLYDTLGKIHSLFSHRALQKDLQFSYHIAKGTPRYILTDETRFLQILSNLTSNAIKFTNEGEVSIWVDCEPVTKEEYLLYIEVRDSGIGITPEDQRLLFTDFTQLDNSSTKTFGGTGLGLAISKQITLLLGGDIGVESEPGKGSSFWFRIRVKLADTQEVQAHLEKQHQVIEVEAFTNSPYILLVDDNLINQKVAEKQLERLGCRIEIASNGFEAIERATTHEYDIIFMDIQMPEMDGVTAMKIIKEKLGTSCPPIVAMTAYSMKDDAVRFINEGMDDYVSKPVKSADLSTVIWKWVNHDKHKPANSNRQQPEEEIKQPEPDQPVIDVQVVEQLKQIGGTDFALQLYVEFEEEAAGLLSDAQKELEAQHYKSILSTLHQLKGTGFTLGINSFAELAKQLEHDIKNDQMEEVSDNFDKLVKQYEIYKKAYKEIIT